MRTHRLAIAGIALLASTSLISCGSDDDDTPSNDTGTPAVGDTVVVTDTLPLAETIPLETTAP